MNKLPWTVKQYNTDIDCEYKPVNLVDANGNEFLRVGHNKAALELAQFIVDGFVTLGAGVLAAKQVTQNWSEGDLARAVNELEDWADETLEMLV